MSISSKKFNLVMVSFILGIMFLLEVSSAINQSQIIDEGTHLASGYAYLKRDNFDLNPEHPPLAKYLSALPLLFLNIDNKFDTAAYQENNQWEYARQFIHNNSVSHHLILNLGRLPIMLLSLLLGLIIFKLAEHFFGTKTAFFALILYAFDPNIIAHSRYITTDILITFFIFLTVLLWVKYLSKPTWKNFVMVALSMAGASLTKFSFVILFPIMFIIYIISFLQKRNLSFKKCIGVFFLILSISYLFIFVFYRFEFEKPIVDPTVARYYENLPDKLQGLSLDQTYSFGHFWYNLTNPATWHGQFIKWFSYHVPVPAYSYFKGFYILSRHNYFGHTAYLLGNISKNGWWYYFPVAFLVKTPLSLIIFLILATCSLFIYYLRSTKIKTAGYWFDNRLYKAKLFFKNIPIQYYAIFLAPSIYFAWALTSRLNIGLRHLLPIYPFIYLIIAVFIAKLKRRDLMAISLTGSLIVYFLFSSLFIYPNYLSYFNELAGGPGNGHLILADSNIDWGQGLIQLKKYMDENNIESIYLHYFGSVDPRSYGINWQSPPDNQQIKENPHWHGIIAISSTAVHDAEFSWLNSYQPIKKIGYSIWIFEI